MSPSLTGFYPQRSPLPRLTRELQREMSFVDEFVVDVFFFAMYMLQSWAPVSNIRLETEKS